MRRRRPARTSPSNIQGAAAATTMPPPSARPMNAPPKNRILVVEDDGIIAEDIRVTLTRLGYEVPRTSSTSEEALRAMEEINPALVLMDIHLRGPVDGVETVTKIKERWDVPVVFLTAHSDEATLARARETRPHGYLVKPFKERELRTAIEVAIGRHELETQLARRERWFSTTLESIGDAVIATDAEEKISLMNGVAERLTGWSREAAIGRPFTEVFSLVDHRGRPLADPLSRAIRKRALVGVPSDARLKTPSGEIGIEVDDSAAPIVDERGQILGGVVVFRDVTDRRRLETRLAQSERLVSIGTLTAGVAHEINNPLAAIIANLDYAESVSSAFGPDVAGELGEALRDAREAAERIRRIVLDLRRFARAEDKPATTIELPIVIDAAVRLTERMFRLGPPVAVHYGPTPFVEADEGRLTQVFVNLLANAAHAVAAVPGGPGFVTVSTRTDAEGRAVIAVSDTGTGIDPEVIGRIFDPFFTTKQVGEGTGLGLSISHGVVTALGGSITVQSEPGKGSTFEVVLPPASGKLTTIYPPPSVRTSRSLRILVIDDEEPILRSLERLLRDHSVACVTKASDALERVTRGDAFDVILCDIFMPTMNGLDFYRVVNERDPALAKRIVFMTGGAISRQIDEEIGELANRRVEKPFAKAAVMSVVEEVGALIGAS
ncbi:MAG: response regulator [Deltaproteobacteria bacterium]|nr:response regulator [Deltaproteobacteria bacterium]